jgi:hypothetical protein
MSRRKTSKKVKAEVERYGLYGFPPISKRSKKILTMNEILDPSIRSKANVKQKKKSSKK